jgi:predicted Zn-dependent protease
MIKRVGDRIAKAAQVLMAEYGQSDRLKDYNWEFNLIDSDEINAFCMAGGKVAFYTGILPICKDENGVATVMGHEVAHALARHGAERASQQMAAGIGSTVLELALGASSVSPGTGQAIMIAYGLGAQYGVLLPYSRAHEAEADRIGLSLMALAGYDPRRSLEFWQRMSAATGNSGSSFFQTHPSDQERMANIQEYINEALQRAEANHVKFTD